MQLYIDLKPALSPQQLDKRLLRDLSENLHKQIGNALAGLLPARLLPQILALAEISPYEKGDALTKEQRLKLVQTLKAVPLTITGTSDFKEAIITQGGFRSRRSIRLQWNPNVSKVCTWQENVWM